MKAEKTGIKSGKLRRAVTFVLTVLMIVLAALAFLFRDKLSREGLRDLFSWTGWAEPSAEEAFTFETGSDQVFALAGNGLAVASSTGFQLLGDSGEPVQGRGRRQATQHRPAPAGGAGPAERP
jgi:hypothetical protein